MPRVRTTQRPDQVIEVDEHEVGELRRLGILHSVEDDATPDAEPDDAPADRPKPAAPKPAGTRERGDA